MNKEFIKKINVLYVEDEDVVRDLTTDLLNNFVRKIVPAVNGADGLEIFKAHNLEKTEDSFDLIVTDINMPKMNGLEMINAIRDIDSTIPVVVTTAHNDPEFLKEAINLKVKGYVSKPLNMSDLIENIIQAVESKFLRFELEVANKKLTSEVEFKTKELKKVIDELEAKNTVLTYQSTHDSLTELPNRLKLNDELDREILRENRYKHDLSLFMIDIDNFKLVNDNYGHDVGDIVLKDLSKLLKDVIRETDMPCRWGGEEFIVLLTETNVDDGFRLAEIIRKKFKCLKFDGIDEPISVSIGLTSFLVGTDDKDSFIKNADIALYKAKNSGKDKVVIYEK